MDKQFNKEQTLFTLDLVLDAFEDQLKEKVEAKDIGSIKEVANLIDDVEDLMRSIRDLEV